MRVKIRQELLVTDLAINRGYGVEKDVTISGMCSKESIKEATAGEGRERFGYFPI